MDYASASDGISDTCKSDYMSDNVSTPLDVLDLDDSQMYEEFVPQHTQYWSELGPEFQPWVIFVCRPRSMLAPYGTNRWFHALSARMQDRVLFEDASHLAFQLPGEETEDKSKTQEIMMDARSLDLPSI